MPDHLKQSSQTPAFSNGETMGFYTKNTNRQDSKRLVRNKKRLYSLLECICEDYISMTEIDLDSDTYEMFMVNPSIESLGVPFKGKFTETFQQAAREHVSQESSENVVKVFDSEYIRQTLATRRKFECEFELVFQSMGWQKVTFVVMERDQGIPVKVLMTQVTVDKGRKEQLRQQKAILEAYNYAEAANAAKTNFLSHMSHDMRTPMNGIIGMTSIAKANMGNDDKVADCLGKIETASNQLLELINEVLDLSRIESGREELREDEIEMGDFIESVISMIRPQAGQKGQTLTVTAQKIVNEKLIGDKHKLSQILLNLLSNAVKYTPDGGKITLTIEERDTNDPGSTEYVLKVEDNGFGMTDEFQKTLFDPFTRAKDLRVENTVGSGLGMSITKNLVRMLHGTITVFSRIDEGTRFEVRLPLKLSTAAGSVNLTMFSGKSALLVCNHANRLDTDCTADGKCIEEYLSRIGFTCKVIADLAESFRYLELAHKDGKDPSIIFLKSSYERADSFNVLRALRGQLQITAPIVMLLGQSDPVLLMKASDAGATMCLAEPVFRSNLFDCLKKTLKPSEDEEGSAQETDFSGRRLLLAEDNDLNAEIAMEIIGSTGAIIERAHDGREALEMFKASSDGYYDMILMDIQMPELDGYESTSAIRALETEYALSTPIVALTANAFSTDAVRALEAGMDAHLAKPIEFEKLYEIMRKYIMK